MAEEQSVLNQVLEDEKKQEQSAPEVEVEEPKAEEKKPEEKKKEEPKPEAKKQEEQKPRKRIAENVVLVGKKPTMSYVLAVVTQFSDGINDVHIKARGRSISRAVDVAEVVRNRFVQGVKVDVQIGTQEIIDENQNKINVSTVDIALIK